MANSLAAAREDVRLKTGFQKFCVRFKRNWELHLMLLVMVCYVTLFDFVPMYGLQVGLKDYSPRLGIMDSLWVGLGNYKEFFEYYRWPNLVWNTIVLSLYGMATYPIPIILALMIHINTHDKLKKIAQNISYIPHFISLVVMIGIINTVLNPVTGFLGYINRALGNFAYEDIRTHKSAFRHLYEWSGVWQSTGWGAILYVSALSSVPEELHEAAKLDGASRLRRVFAVDLPTIVPIIVLQLIQMTGGLMSVGYQKAYLLQAETNLEVSEIISTYVYKNGIQKGNMGLGSAIGLFNQVINICLVTFSNWVANVLSDGEMGLF